MLIVEFNVIQKARFQMTDLSSLFPPSVIITIASNEMWSTPLCTEEEQLIEGAVEKRQREFRAGRNAAHAILNQLNAPSGPILRGEKRQPTWPAGFLGSITHCRERCVVACTKKGDLLSLGLDVEPLSPLSKGIARYIDTPEETQFKLQHETLPARLFFSAKESLYKCYYPLIGRYFGFQSINLNFDLSRQRFQFTPTSACTIRFPENLIFHGRYQVDDKHLYTSCFLTQKQTGLP
ncbi:MAG: 4'-phosphopantetheinyl transferase superfamily protein [Candidatus Thiodiazotropha sp. (ex Codakia rugifera)]|nr:4'-phosphopantetheinyl transferase superfamily protein [Candidatus Thiodiazotropha sp. (ex Codakia rugifera)]